MCLKRWYGLGLAGLLSLAGMGSATVGGTLPLAPSVLQGEPATTAPAIIPPLELRTFSAGGHVLGFAPQYLLTANGRHAIKVEFIGARTVMPQSTTAAGDSSVQKAPPLTEVRYPNPWEGIDLSYRATPGGIAESLYHL